MARISLATWFASSRVGASTMACVTAWSVSIPATMGIPKAPVLPLPVRAWTMRSPPPIMRGMTRAWTGIGLSQPRSRMPLSMSSGSSATSLKESGMRG
jgi:hypothetical protein